MLNQLSGGLRGVDGRERECLAAVDPYTAVWGVCLDDVGSPLGVWGGTVPMLASRLRMMNPSALHAGGAPSLKD